MFTYMIAFVLAFAWPGHSDLKKSSGQVPKVIVLDDTGGETGHVPPNAPGHP